MAEIAAPVITSRLTAILRRPIVGQFYPGHARLSRRRHEDQREAARLDIEAADFLQPDQLEKADRRIRIADPDHAVKIFDHRLHIHSKTVDRKSDVEGKSVTVRVALGGRRCLKKKKKSKTQDHKTTITTKNKQIKK